jgi:hypothetical protein
VDVHARNVGVALGTLLASSATLLCCVLPAVMVSIGAGATLVALVTTVPQLVWLSEHKEWVFVIAGGILLLTGALMLRARSMACPTDPKLARSCSRLRRTGLRIYGLAMVAYAVGATFAFAIPALTR